MTEKQAEYGNRQKVTYREAADAILGDPSSSFWLKDAIKALDQRDSVDVINDVALLLKLQKMRVDEALGNEDTII